MEKKDEISKIEEYLKVCISSLIEVWAKGEGDVVVEVRNDGGTRRGKIKRGPIYRV